MHNHIKWTQVEDTTAASEPENQKLDTRQGLLFWDTLCSARRREKQFLPFVLNVCMFQVDVAARENSLEETPEHSLWL